VAAGHAAVTVPVELNGTLTVDYKSATTTMDVSGDSTQTTPVAGRLGSVGMVRGVWVESDDVFGDDDGVDTLRLHNGQGTFVIVFNNTTLGPAHPAAHGAVYYTHLQRIAAGAGAYANASESGSIQLFTDPSRVNIVSIGLNTTS
jgi:hypothetical protein